jgi:aryl-alcohol dehydrogenase-like predicted oxidoreductase
MSVLSTTTRISLGCVTFGREISAAAAHSLMDLAVACGIDHFDTAAQYAEGGGEKVVGEWLARRRSGPPAPEVATKIPPPYTAATIDRQVVACSQRLGIGTLDLLYLHKWHASAASEEALRALDRLVQDGRVRRLGASNFSTTQLAGVLERQDALGLARFHALQVVNNYALRGVDADTVRLCAAQRVVIITYSPLGAGFLTGKHRGGVAPGSRFDVVPGHQSLYFQPEAERRLARLEEISARTGLSKPHLALKWALHRPTVSRVLIGAREPRHLTQAFEALRCPVPCRELFPDD